MVSQTALEQVLKDIEHYQQTGIAPNYVNSFFAAHPDWIEEDEQANGQTNKQQEEAQK